MGDPFESMSWLPPTPDDFRARVRALVDLEAPQTDAGAVVARLATHALDENDLRRLGKAVEMLRARGHSLAPLTPFRLGIVGNATLAPLAGVLIGSAARHGIALDVHVAEYGQTIAEALDPQSAINRARCDAVLAALDHRGLPLENVSEALAFVRRLRDGFRTNGGAPSIVTTVPGPADALFGSFDRVLADSERSRTSAFNAGLADDVRASADVLFDVAALAERVGLGRWHAHAQWHVAKFPFDAAFLPLYAEQCARLLGALRGKSRKCLVVDLDNTLWGGTIGDDGVEGIAIGQGDAVGEAFLDVQRTVRALRDRGIVLAVSSKNEDAVARKAFAHPDMLLRESDFAVFQANWNDKATNLRAIATELALGLDALVFLDDNPAERDLIRRLLPDVAVPEVTDDPALYGTTLLSAGYFESVTFSNEDRDRAAYYESNARRVALERDAGDLEGYLASLEMTIAFRPFDAAGRSRIAQLINKSNQFNLTTRRYTEADVIEIERDPDCFTLQIRLADRFGDNGMIGVVIARARQPAIWEIDTWLMSCRVLGRRVEEMTLREIVHHAGRRGVAQIVGRFVPTAKNMMVAGLYERLGFALLDREADGATTWTCSPDIAIADAPMIVDRSGFEASRVAT